MVAQIDTMWTGNDGMTYFNGPWFVMPLELPPHQQGKSRAENPMRKNRWKEISKNIWIIPTNALETKQEKPKN